MRNDIIKVPTRLLECKTLTDKEKLDCLVVLDWLLCDLYLPGDEHCKTMTGIESDSFDKALENLFYLDCIKLIVDDRNTTWFIPVDELLLSSNIEVKQ